MSFRTLHGVIKSFRRLLFPDPALQSRKHTGRYFSSNAADIRHFSMQMESLECRALLSAPQIDGASATSLVTQGGPIKITWNTSGTVDHVGLYLVNSSGDQKADILITKQADGSVNWTIPSNVGTGSGFKIKVVAWGSNTNPDPRTYAFTNTFTIVAQPRVEATSVNASIIQQGEILTTTWSTSGTVDHVGLYLVAPDGSQVTLSINRPANGSYSWPTPSNVGTGGGFKVKVVAWASNINPDPRDFKYTSAFSINPQVPAAPDLFGPGNGSTDISLSPQFTWSSVNGAESYRIVLSTVQSELPTDPSYNGSPSPAHGFTAATAGTSFVPATPLIAGTTYFWKVHGGRLGVGGDWSEARSFTTSVVQLPTPTLKAISATGTDWIHLAWTAAANADMYHLFRSTNPNDINPTAIYHGTGTEYVDSGPGLIQGQTYYYWVKASVGTSYSAFSNSRSALLTTAQSTPTVVAGHVFRENDVDYDVSLRVVNGAGLNLSLNAPTWIVTHGLDSSPAAMQSLVNGILHQRPGDRIVVLDWSKVADRGSGEGLLADNWIPTIGVWASAALRRYGFNNPQQQLNLVGHSWGACVSARIAKELGGVNSIVALDPGHDGLGSDFNTDNVSEISFSENSNWSWAFHTPEISAVPYWFDQVLSSTSTPSTADESFVVRKTDHSGIVKVFANLLNGTNENSLGNGNDVSRRFPLYSLLHHQPYPYLIPNRFRFDGSTGTSADAAYEAVFDSNGDQAHNFANGLLVQSVQFFNTQDATEPVIRYSTPQMCVDQTIVLTSASQQRVSQAAGLSLAALNISTNAITSLNTVTNFTSSPSSAGVAVFYASNDPASQGTIFNLGSRPVESLLPGHYSNATNALSLDGLPASVFDGGRLFVAMAVNPNGTPQHRDLDWLQVLINSSDLMPDLTGTNFDIEPRPANYGWGQTVSVDYRFTNQGTGYASGLFTNGVYLSNDTVLDPSDVLLKQDEYDGVAAGATLGTALNVSLPTSAPIGFSDGSMYLLLGVDDKRSIDESNDSNNSGRGSAVDYRSITVSGTPPTPGSPTIGSFTAGATTLVRGEYLSLTASNVTDDGVVNEVVFYIDTNGNGNLDISDYYVDHGSKSLTTFTSRVSTDGWPTGPLTLFAQAKDNNDNVSIVKSLHVNVVGLGTAVDDAYERNDSQVSATYLGGAGTHTLNNLSITQGDMDYFSFDIPNGNGKVQIDLSFLQEAPQTGHPVGDLELELLRSDGSSSWYSTGSYGIHFGHESITIDSLGSGRYTARVFAANVFGGSGLDQNSNYTIQVSVTPPANYPVEGVLTATPNPVRHGDIVTLLLTGNSVASGATIDQIAFFRDANANGIIEAEELLGWDAGNPDGPNGSYKWSGSTASWPEGTSKVYAFVSDNLGRSGLATSIEVNVIANLPPTITSVSAPSSVIHGDHITLTAQMVTDDESVRQVIFYGDTNGDGKLDINDASVGTGTQSENSWSVVVDTSGLPVGSTTIFAKAIDHRNAESTPVAVVLTIEERVNLPPRIGSLSGPASVLQNGTFTLQATNVTDSDGAVSQVAFYRDSNFNGQLDVADLNLGNGTQIASNWTKLISTAGWEPGRALIFVRATDNGLPNLEMVQSFSLDLVNSPPVIDGVIASQVVNDNASINPFGTMTVSDPDNQNMFIKTTILNGVVRGDFTSASVTGWTRSVIGNNVVYSRFYSPAANIGSVVQAALRGFVFVPRANAIKPNSSELTDIQVFINDGIANTTTTSRLTTTSVNDVPTLGGTTANVIVNDNGTVNPFTSLTVGDLDLQEMLISVTILNGTVRGDFTAASTAGWTVRYVIGNNITYKRYFSPQANVGAAAQAAFRALVFQPRQNAINPGTTEATDFQVTVSDGVAPAVLGTGTRVTTTSINNAPVIGGAVAGQTLHDNQTKAVFSTLTVTDPDTQAMNVIITIPNGVNRGDFTAGSTTGWTRTVVGVDLRYNRYFSATANIGATVQTAIRALVFQPRTNVPVSTSETTGFTVFVNDGLANTTNNTTSVITTGVAPRVAIDSPTVFHGNVDTIVVPWLKRPMTNSLARLLRKSRSTQ